jgi:FkbM family methyltransferase
MSFPACYQVYGRDFYIEPASAQFANAVFQDEYQVNVLRTHHVRTIVDIGAHVGSFTVLCHHYWPDARILAVEPHPESFDLLVRNTAHIPKEKLTLIHAAVSRESGRCILSSPVSHSRVSEYVPKVWESLEPRPADFGLQVDAITPKDLWEKLVDVGMDEVDLLKLDCEGAEYLIISELSALGLMDRIGWIRGEWHSRKFNHILAGFLAQTHVFHIDPNPPHSVGMFVAHRAQ